MSCMEKMIRLPVCIIGVGLSLFFVFLDVVRIILLYLFLLFILHTCDTHIRSCICFKSLQEREAEYERFCKERKYRCKEEFRNLLRETKCITYR